MTTLVDTRINQRWSLLLPEHRAARAEWWDGWEKERLAAMYDAIQPGDVVYDIGSEEGDLPALFAMWASPRREKIQMDLDGNELGRKLSGGVVLFEPDPRVWPNIRATFEGNGLRPLDCYVGFAGEHTTADFDMESRDSEDSCWPACAYGPIIDDHGFCNLNERPDIPAITIDDHAVSRGIAPTVLSIDSEGSELHVLHGAQGVLSIGHPVVFVSIHPEFMREMYEHSPEGLFAFMYGLGYTAEHIATDHEEHYCFWPSERQRPF